MAGTRSYTDAIEEERKASKERLEAFNDPKKLEILSKERSEKLKEASKENIVTQIQMIFQDPIASLNPRMTVREIISEGLTIQGIKDRSILTGRCMKCWKK